jgi:hypothetical protein
MKKPNEHKLDIENKVKAFCETRIPEEIRDKIKMTYEVKGNKITIIEERPPWTGEGPWTKMAIAQVRFNEEQENWTLYWRDRNEKWHLYTEITPVKNVEEIINEVDKDPSGIFWG